MKILIILSTLLVTCFLRKHTDNITIFSGSQNKTEFIAFTRQKAHKKVGKYFAKLQTVQEWKFCGFVRNVFFPCIMFTFDIMLLSCIFHHRAEFTNESNVAKFLVVKIFYEIYRLRISQKKVSRL